MNAFFLVDKPAGWTSFDVCAKLRGLTGVKRVGHTGTLDPFATGLLVVAVGKWTKLIPYFEKAEKTYQTEIWFGKTSETLDPESEIEVNPKQPEIKQEQIQTILEKNFTGEIEQVPPKYSALKIDGKRAYELARKGLDVEMKKRKTKIVSSKILKFDEKAQVLNLEIRVSAGFYVRSFARDLAEKLGTTGMCGALRRMAIGELEIKSDLLTKSVITEKELKASSLEVSDYVLEPHTVLNSLETVVIETERWPDFRQGRAVMLGAKEVPEINQRAVLVLCEEKTIGLGLFDGRVLQPKIVG